MTSRCGRTGYARIWLRLHQSPANSYEIAEEFGLLAQTARQILWAMVRVRTLSVVSWAPRIKSGMPVPYFAPGEGEIARYPGNIGQRRLPGFASRSRVPRTDMVSWGVVVQCLRDGMRINDIAEACGGSHAHLRPLIRAMHKAKAVHISEWHRGPREAKWVAVYELGSKPDAKRPPPLTHAQRHARSKQRKQGLWLHSAFTGARVQMGGD